MIKFNLLPASKAIEHIHGELADYTMAATTITNKFWFFVNWLDEVECFLDFVQLPETTENDCPEITDRFFNDTIELMEKLPGIIVCYPQIEWTDIINSIITLLNEYIGYQDTICKVRVNEDQTIKINQLREHLQHLAHFMQFGASIELLLAVMNQLIERAEHFNSNQPMTFELSKMYLDAMNFKGNEEFTI